MRAAALLMILLAACASPAASEPTPTAPPTPRPAASHTALPSPSAQPNATASPEPSSTPRPVVSAACQDAFAAAASVPPYADSVEDLNPAVRACVSLEEWGSAAAANPGAIEPGVDPYEYLGNRCDYGEGLSATTLCGALLAVCGNQPYANTTYCLTH